MKDRPAKNTSPVAWLQGLQNSLQTVTKEKELVETLEKEISSLPGILDHTIHLQSDSEPQTGTQQPTSGTNHKIFIPLRTPRREYGEIQIHLSDREAFSPFLPVLETSARIAALQIENTRMMTDMEILSGKKKHPRAESVPPFALDHPDRLKLAMEATKDGLWDWNITTGDVYYNPSYSTMLGYSPDGLPPHVNSWADLIHPDDRESTLRVNQDCIENQRENFEIEFRMKACDGNWRWILGRGKAVSRDKNGRALRMIGTHTDITSLKEATEALEKRMEALTRPLENAGDIAFDDLFDLNDIQKLQDEFARATGVASIITLPDGTPITSPSCFCRLCNEIIRKTKKGLANCYHSDAELGRLCPGGPVIQQCMSGGLWDAGASISVGGKHIANWLIGQVRDETQTEENIRAYAREIGADENAMTEAFREVPSMTRDKFDKVAQMLHTLATQLSTTAYLNVQQARFITERKRAEQALLEKERNYRQIFNGTNEAIFIHDLETNKFVDVNDSMLRMYGYEDREEVFQLGIDSFSSQEDAFTLNHAQDWLRKSTEEGPQVFEWHAKRRDGSLFWAEVSLRSCEIDGKRRILAVVRDITERKQGQQALAENRALLNQILDTVPQSIFWKNKEGRYMGCNRAFATAAGLDDPKKIIGKTDYDMPWTREESEAYRTDDREVLENNRPKLHIIETQQQADGRTIWVDTSKTPMLDQEGKPFAILGVFENITERKQAEEEQRKSQMMLQLVLDNIPQYVCWKDRNFRFLGCNRNVSNLAGLPDPQAIVGLTDWDLPWSSDQTDSFIQTDKRIMDTDKPEYRIIEPILSSDGQYKWLETSKIPLHDLDGKVSGILISFEDITDRKKAEADLQASEEKFRRIVESSPMAMYFYHLESDERLVLIGANPSADRVIGINHKVLFGKTIEDAFPALASTKIPAIYRQVAKGELDAQSFDVDYSEERFSGTYEVHVFKTAENSIAVNFLDISSRKRAERDKLALERQVQHAQKLESLGVLAGGIAHDFNNLLMAILGNADLALDVLSPMSPARTNILEVEKAAKRAAELAKQMLAYSGKGRFVIEPIDAEKLVEEMAHLLVVSISKKAVLKFNFARNVPTFDGDATQIRQIIMNLITNASEAIDEKSGVIALSTGVMFCDRAYLDTSNEIIRATLDEPLAEGFYTYIEVADTGCGMDAHTIERIFDPFFTTKFTGRGLGMSAVLGIVRGHRGAIKIYSELGKGSSFKILFPANDNPEVLGTLHDDKTTDQKSWKGTGTILIADDEESVRTVGRQMLERMGFGVLTAMDGREALALFREHSTEIVCVLLDLTMPHMDGEEAFRELRRLNAGVKVILCSGYNEQDAVQRFAGKGLAGFIQKPYTLNILRDKLRETLQ